MTGPAVVIVAHPFARGAHEGTRNQVVRIWWSVGAVEVHLTTGYKDGARAARAAAEAGARVVVALGGDGTFNSVASGLIGTDAAFAPIPAGSTNVLTRALGLPNDPLSVSRTLAAAAINGVEAILPVGRVGPHVFLSNAGVGFDAQVVQMAESHPTIKRLSGPGAYAWATARTLGLRRRSFSVTVEDAEEAFSAQFLSVQNVSPYTYVGRRALEVASGNHGILPGFTLLAVPRVSLFSLAKLVGGALRHPLEGTRLGGEAAVLGNVARVEVEATAELPLQVDGEPVVGGRAVRFERAVETLRLYLPARLA